MIPVKLHQYIVLCFSRLSKIDRSPACNFTFANLTFLKLEWGTWKYLLTCCQGVLSECVLEFIVPMDSSTGSWDLDVTGSCSHRGAEPLDSFYQDTREAAIHCLKKCTQDCLRLSYWLLPSAAMIWEQVEGVSVDKQNWIRIKVSALLSVHWKLYTKPLCPHQQHGTYYSRGYRWGKWLWHCLICSFGNIVQ